MRRLTHTPLALKDTLGDKLYDAYISSMLTPFSIDEVRLMERKTLYQVSTKCGNDKTFYRFGFNVKEQDPEFKGKHNVQDYGFRMNDTRYGRFFSVDPLSAKYPMLSTYQFASNSPIMGIDLDGLELMNFETSMYSMVMGRNKIGLQTKVNIENVPKAIRSEQNGKNELYFNINVILPTTTGKEPLEPTFRQSIGNGKLIPEFIGRAGEATMTDIEEMPSYLRGNDLTSVGAKGTPQNSFISTGATAAAAVQVMMGFIANTLNGSIWEGCAAEKENRRNYYRATNAVNKALSTPQNESAISSVIGDGNINEFRADLVNYVLDGRLPKTDASFTSPIGGFQVPTYSEKKEVWVKNIIYIGNQIMKHSEIEIKTETKDNNSTYE